MNFRSIRSSNRMLWAVLLVLNGCTGLRSHEPGAQIYRLNVTEAAPAAVEPAAARQTEVGATLAVSRPMAASGLDIERIAVLRSDGRLDYYAASRWAGNVPDVLQTLLIDAQRKSGRWRAVLADTSPFSTEQQLQIEVRQFHAEYPPTGGPPSVHVVLEGTLGRRSSHEVLRTLYAEARVTASADRMLSVIAAFNAALTETMRQLDAQMIR